MFYIQRNVLGFGNFIFLQKFCVKSFAFSFSYAFFRPSLCTHESALSQSFLAF